MAANSLITLLTDFGDDDVYGGVMKGAIAQVNQDLHVVDLTHQIPPQNLRAGRFALMNAYPYFPPGTVHIAVVDPGVGSPRRGVAIQLSGGILVGPDNGLLSGVLSQETVLAAVELDNPKYWRVPQPSYTFHGRDIFAPVGAFLATGVPLDQVGSPINPETLVSSPFIHYRETLRAIEGCIQYIDHFGNLITNIPTTAMTNRTWSLVVHGQKIPPVQTYESSPPGKLLALMGSHGWVEIAVNQGNAQQQLQLQEGDIVTVVFN